MVFVASDLHDPFQNLQNANHDPSLLKKNSDYAYTK